MDAKMLIVSAVMGVGLFGTVELPNGLKEALPSMVMYRYDHKMVETHKNISPIDEEHRIISRFLQENRTGWEYDARSYAPSILFKGPTYSINLFSDGIIINFQSKKDEWKQISKSCNEPYCGLSQVLK